MPHLQHKGIGTKTEHSKSRKTNSINRKRKKHRRKSVTGRRWERGWMRQRDLQLTSHFHAEVAGLQIEVESGGSKAQTGVGSAPDNSNIDKIDGTNGDSDGDDDDEIEIHEDDLELFTEARRSLSLSISHYY